MSVPRSQSLVKLTRRHGVKVTTAVSVEECCLAIGEVVGHEHIMSASRMNSATVVFLSTVEKANEVVETGVVIDNLFTPVLPLSMPSKKVLLSNVPPFVSDETLVRIMSRYGKIVSPIKMISSGCKSPLLKHVVSFRRFLFMILKDDEELDVSLHLKIDDCDYVIYATTEKMKCFSCGEVGHLIRTCPSKVNDTPVAVDGAGNVGEAAEAGPSNAVTFEAESDKKKTKDDASLLVSESMTNKTTESKSVVEGNSLVNADTRISESVAETNMQRGDGADSVLQSDLLWDGFEMETEQSEFKVPAKRKKANDFQTVKAKKADVEDDDCDDEMESGNESSDSSVNLSQNDFSIRSYEAEDIKLFLRATKNKRGVHVAEFFPDTKQFVDKTKLFMSEGLFTNKEIYRLKKIVRGVSAGDVNETSEKN